MIIGKQRISCIVTPVKVLTINNLTVVLRSWLILQVFFKLRMRVWLLIACMMTVTFLPRLLPGFLIGKLHYGKKIEKFLRLIPYTAMTALVIPGIFSVDATYWWVGAVGGAVAIACSCIQKMPLAVTVIASVASVAMMYNFV